MKNKNLYQVLLIFIILTNCVKKENNPITVGVQRFSNEEIIKAEQTEAELKKLQEEYDKQKKLESQYQNRIELIESELKSTKLDVIKSGQLKVDLIANKKALKEIEEKNTELKKKLDSTEKIYEKIIYQDNECKIFTYDQINPPTVDPKKKYMDLETAIYNQGKSLNRHSDSKNKKIITFLSKSSDNKEPNIFIHPEMVLEKHIKKSIKIANTRNDLLYMNQIYVRIMPIAHLVKTLNNCIKKDIRVRSITFPGENNLSKVQDISYDKPHIRTRNIKSDPSLFVIEILSKQEISSDKLFSHILQKDGDVKFEYNLKTTDEKYLTNIEKIAYPNSNGINSILEDDDYQGYPYIPDLNIVDLNDTHYNQEYLTWEKWLADFFNKKPKTLKDKILEKYQSNIYINELVAGLYSKTLYISPLLTMTSYSKIANQDNSFNLKINYRPYSVINDLTKSIFKEKNFKDLEILKVSLFDQNDNEFVLKTKYNPDSIIQKNQITRFTKLDELTANSFNPVFYLDQKFDHYDPEFKRVKIEYRAKDASTKSNLIVESSYIGNRFDSCRNYSYEKKLSVSDLGNYKLYYTDDGLTYPNSILEIDEDKKDFIGNYLEGAGFLTTGKYGQNIYVKPDIVVDKVEHTGNMNFKLSIKFMPRGQRLAANKSDLKQHCLTKNLIVGYENLESSDLDFQAYYYVDNDVKETKLEEINLVKNKSVSATLNLKLPEKNFDSINLSMRIMYDPSSTNFMKMPGLSCNVYHIDSDKLMAKLKEAFEKTTK